ncbi:Branched-chain amino acid transport system / permease component [Modestobacter sp. DSM 44400]|nr:Branched-chain amino acid transport system / permease component [Modestobacter sp. DSM 44400]
MLAVGLPGLALRFQDTLGGEQGLRVRAPRAPDWFGDAISTISGNQTTTTKWLAYVGATALIITYFLLANLVRNRIGRTGRAVRDNDVAAELAGIRLGSWRVLAFVVSAAWAAECWRSSSGWPPQRLDPGALPGAAHRDRGQPDQGNQLGRADSGAGYRQR